jgi:hypothetical protein
MAGSKITGGNKKYLRYELGKGGTWFGGGVGTDRRSSLDGTGAFPISRAGRSLDLAESGRGRVLPFLDHEIQFFQQSIDLFEIFPAPFLRFQIQGATKGDHIA